MINQSRELLALEGLTESCLSELNQDQMLGSALSHLASGTAGAEVAGIFLLEQEGLQLRAMLGSVEELISFIEGAETVRLLSQPLVHPTQAMGKSWISAPIIGNGQTKGLAVLALMQEADRSSLKFLEKAAGRIGRLLDAASPEMAQPSAQETLSRIKAGSSQD